jgi:tetratricopeptide (TPR) repeat protein
MQSGNRFYEQGEYEKAVREYEKILNADLHSAILHYNLGCAYFNLEMYGKSILHFEKAKILKPRDADINHNLRFTKLFLKDRFDTPEPMPLVKWFINTRNSLSISELRGLEIISFILLVSMILVQRFLLGRGGETVRIPALVIASMLFVFTSGWLLDRTLSLKETNMVVLADEIPITSAPVPGSSTLFVIHEGTSGLILNTTDTWYEIRLPDGKSGWIPHEAVDTF